MDAALFGKVLFVLSVFASFPWSRYQQILFLDHGVTPAQLGQISLVATPFKAAGYVMWGVLADRIGLKRALFISIIGASGVLELFRSGVAWQSMYLVFLGKIVRTTCNAAFPLSDAYAVKAVGHENYGSIRMYGSLAWGLAGVGTGFILDYFHAEYGYSSIFAITYVLTCVLLLLIWMYFPANVHAKDVKSKKSSLSWKEALGPLLMNKRLMLFLTVNVAFGFAVSVSTQVVTVWTKLNHDASAQTLGFITLCHVVFGLPIFFWSKELLSRYGAKRLFQLSFAAHAVRLMLYGAVDKSNNGWLLPLIETLHCFSFGLYWNSATSYGHSLVDEHHLATAQTFLSSSHFIVAQLFGGFVFLSLLESHGFHLICCAGVVLTALAAVLCHFFVHVPKQLTEVLESKDARD